MEPFIEGVLIAGVIYFVMMMVIVMAAMAIDHKLSKILKVLRERLPEKKD